MKKDSSYYRNLIAVVIANSEADTWENAVHEWIIHDVEEDANLEESCVCGKEELKYLFTIKNRLNQKVLFPLGSRCIKRFERSDLNEEVAIKEKLFKLLHAVNNNDFLTLSSNLFSRKLLDYLFDVGAFKPTSYNFYRPSNDLDFMIQMFNRRKPMTPAQERKTVAILLNSIKPFLQTELMGKIRK